MEFIESYGLYLILLFGIIAFIGYIIWTLKTKGPEATLDEFREVLYKLMLAAEKKLSDGDEKFKFVTDRFYVLLPDVVKLLFTEEDIQDYVQEVYDEFIIDYLDDGLLNDSNE